MAEEQTHNERFEELCAGYVLDALSPEERREFEALLLQADQAQLQQYHAMRSTANQLAFTVKKNKPRRRVKKQLMKQLQSTSARSKKGYSRTALAIAASFALLIISAALIFYTFNLRANLDNKETVIASQQTRIEKLQNEIQRKEELLSILSARTVDLIVLSGMEVNPKGYGKIIWDPQKEQALLQVSNLPPTPPGKDYQLWIIKNNKPMPSGLFTVSKTGEDAFFKIEAMPSVDQQNANAFAITLEPEGGMPQPTGAMYLLGSNEK